MIKNIIHHRGGLHNRITQRIHLQPFDLCQTKHFLRKRTVRLNDQQIASLYMVTGGIPLYLMQIEPDLSAAENIEKMAFNRAGLFVDEFEKLFSSLFDKHEVYTHVIRILAKKREGMGARQLLEEAGKHLVGATGQKILTDLEQTGFVMKFKPLYHKTRGHYYRLVDEYSLFYLHWIEPVFSTVSKNALRANYWVHMQSSPQWYNWQGYAFENLCYKHLRQIQEALQLPPNALPSSWRSVPQKGSSREGAQIDLLFDRPDGSITICEMKYTKEPFEVNKAFLQEMQRKIHVFQARTKTSKQCFVALVSAQGVKKTLQAQDALSRVVALEDLFSAGE